MKMEKKKNHYKRDYQKDEKKLQDLLCIACFFLQ